MSQLKFVSQLRKHSFFATILIAALILAGLGSTAVRPAQADNAIVVNTLTDDPNACSGTISLRCAITTANAATSPTTITFSVSGTITVGSTLTISNSSANPITIDGIGQSVVVDGQNNYQIFSITSGSVVTMTMLTIQHGYNRNTNGNGGGILNNGTVTINESVLSNNSAFGAGGGIENFNLLTINNSTLSNNFASQHGGAIDAAGNSSGISHSVININNTIFSDDNTDGYGGAITNSGGTLHIETSTFTGNSAVGDGGALYGWSIMTIDRSTFSSNKNVGYGDGGAIMNYDGMMTISNSVLYNNSVISSQYFNPGGGAIASTGFNTLNISNTTLYNNTASDGGAIILIDGAALTMSNSTVSGNNTTAGNGGGIENYNSNSGTLNLLSTIVAGNTVNSGSTGSDISGTANSLGHNLIGDGTGSTGLTNGVNGDQVGSAASPIDPKLAALANNGGSTQTMALFANSPALGAGDCSGNSSVTPPAPAVTTDQRGVSRGIPCDIGAYEASPSLTATSTNTATATGSATVTATSTITATSTNTATFTVTPTSTATATPTSTPTATSTTIPAKIDSIGIYRSGKFYLRLHNATGFADLTVAFTAGTKPYPIVGDWTGAGFDTVGVFDQSNGLFTLCTANVTASCANVANQKSLVLGVPNDVPLSGRWLISATSAGVGVFRPSNGLIYLKNALTTGYADHTMVLGIPSDQGLAGDWNGKGFDSPGVYRPSNSFFYLSNQVTNGSVIGDYQFQYGVGGDSPVIGDWIAQGHDGVGLFRQSNGFTYLKNQLVTGYADNSFTYGIAGDVPVAGHWQLTYPPIASAPILIAKTAVPSQSNGSAAGSNPIGD